MNWIKRTLQEIKAQTKKIFKRQEKIDPSASLWETCPNGHMNYKDSLSEQDWICNKCYYYFDKPPLATVRTWFSDGGTFIEPPEKNLDDDPLNFSTELGSYKDKLDKARKKEKQWCSIVCYKGVVDQLKVHLLVSNFKFLGGSWDNNCAHYFRKAVSDAIEDNSDLFVLVLKTGGVSMFHSTLALNSVMGGGVIDINRLKEKNIVTASVCQSKTTGGVLASVAYTSDFVIYEKGANDVSFAGKRVALKYIEPGMTMDENFATAEEKLATGMADLVLDRDQLKPTICTLAKILKKKESSATIDKTQNDNTIDTSREILPKTAEKI